MKQCYLKEERIEKKASQDKTRQVMKRKEETRKETAHLI